jgi:hypothetical protein
MEPSTWISLGALVVAFLGPALTTLAAGARRDGKVDAVLERLTKITEDHETRLRKGRL